MARSFSLLNLIDDKGLTVINAWCRAFRGDTHALVETQYTDSSGDADFVALIDNVDCYIVAIWANNTRWFFSEATIGATEIDDGAVGTAKIVNLAIDNSKLAALAVDAAKLADSAVESSKIANAAVGSAAIANLAVGTAHIADGAIETAKIGSLQVTDAQIATGTITSAKIDSLTVSKLIAGTMTATVTISNTFKTASSPNPRIEITSSSIAGYSDATTKQFYLQASNGKAYFAGGNAVLDSSGLTISGGQIEVINDANPKISFKKSGMDTSINACVYVDSDGYLRLKGPTVDINGGYMVYGVKILSPLKTAQIQPDSSGSKPSGLTSAYWSDVATRTVTISETSTPSAVANFGKIYTKNTNKLFFQDGAGTEHEVAFA